MIRVVITGAAGRMGQELQAVLSQADDVEIIALIVREDEAALGEPAAVRGLVNYTADLPAALANANLLIDFTHASAFSTVVRSAVDAGVALVSGTTGITDADRALLDQAATAIPVLWASNTSVGVNVMLDLLKVAVERLGDGYDIEVVETHHRHKKDAPSGTAKTLVKALHAARGEGGEIPCHAIRGGDVVGDHTIHFMGPGDRIELTHRATTRRTFAQGALRAARWLVSRSPGQYTMGDALRGETE